MQLKYQEAEQKQGRAFCPFILTLAAVLISGMLQTANQISQQKQLPGVAESEKKEQSMLRKNKKTRPLPETVPEADWNRKNSKGETMDLRKYSVSEFSEMLENEMKLNKEKCEKIAKYYEMKRDIKMILKLRTRS